jgi:hypothetical protein
MWRLPAKTVAQCRGRPLAPVFLGSHFGSPISWCATYQSLTESSPSFTSLCQREHVVTRFASASWRRRRGRDRHFRCQRLTGRAVRRQRERSWRHDPGRRSALRALMISASAAGLGRVWSWPESRSRESLLADSVPWLAIRAGRSVDADALALHWRLLEPELPSGATLGTVELVDCVRDADSPWAEPGEWHWLLADPRPVPVPCRGSLGLWRPPEGLPWPGRPVAG